MWMHYRVGGISNYHHMLKRAIKLLMETLSLEWEMEREAKSFIAGNSGVC